MARAQTIEYSTTTASAIVEAYAAHYGIPSIPLVRTLICESNLQDDAVGDMGTSYGIAQIHLPAHPEVSKKQALDPLWSIDWAAHQFSLGHAKLWSCYKKLYGSVYPPSQRVTVAD